MIRKDRYDVRADKGTGIDANPAVSQQAVGPDGEEFRISRSRADKKNFHL
jgi:hypothetical protein